MGKLRKFNTVEEDRIFAVVPITDKSVEGAEKSYWIQAWKYGTFPHPKYGEEKIDSEFADKLIGNFNGNVYGQDLPIDFEHGIDTSKGLQAAAWIRGMRTESDGVYYLLEFTEDALNEIRAGKWRYFSPAYLPTWTDNNGEVHHDVPTGGGITNRPFFKGMLPLNFSELTVTQEELKEFSDEWREEFIRLSNEIEEERQYSTITNRAELPDSSFLYISPGGTTVDGKTKPDSLRHWPYKTADGKVDPAHVEAALRLIPRTGGVPEAAKSAALTKARSLSTSKEHSEEGNMNEETLRRFAEILGIELPETFTEEEAIAKATELNAMIEPLKAAQEEAKKQRSFREMFPSEYEEMQLNREARIQQDAREFASNYERFTVKKEGAADEKDSRGFSALVLTKIEEAHKEFGEGKATPDTLKAVLDTISSGGIVDYKEYGSNRDGGHDYSNVDLNNTQSVRKAFSDMVKARMTEDSLEYEAAVRLVASENAELFTAYMTPPAA